MSKLRVLDLFSGIGGFSLGLERTGGFETVAFCEANPIARQKLAKNFPGVPIYDDVRTLSAARLAADGIEADVTAGGFPCQDISIAGDEAGIEAERSGLWSEYARIIGEIRPAYALVENVANLLAGPDERPGWWFGRVLGDLASIRYDAEWHGISASRVGASHVRDRVWVIAYPGSARRERPVADECTFERPFTPFALPRNSPTEHWDALVRRELGLRSGDGLPLRVERDRLHECGNAVVPQIPELIGRAILAAEAA